MYDMANSRRWVVCVHEGPDKPTEPEAPAMSNDQLDAMFSDENWICGEGYDSLVDKDWVYQAW